MLKIDKDQIIKTNSVVTSAEFHIRKVELIYADRNIFHASSKLVSLNGNKLNEVNAPIEVRVGGHTEMEASNIPEKIDTQIFSTKEIEAFQVSYDEALPDMTFMNLNLRTDFSVIAAQIQRISLLQPFYISLKVEFKNPAAVFELKSENPDEWTQQFLNRPIIFTEDLHNPWINGYDEYDTRGWEEWHLPEYSPFLNRDNTHGLSLITVDDLSEF